MIRGDRAVLCRNRGTLNQRQKIALHALAADVAAQMFGAGAYFVDLVDKDDAVVGRVFERRAHHLVLIQ